VIFLKSKSPSVNKITILTMLCVFIFGGITSYASEKNIKESESHAQNQLTEIKGNVSNSDGPLPGATVIVKGTSNGTTTDFDGNYSISVDSDDATLVFSFLGHQSQEIALGNSSTVDVILELSTRLDEVVVVGYTTKKRGEITGSISTLKAEDIASTSNREVAKSLAGRVTGLIASDRGGLPGSDSVSLLIRGQATLNNNAPLILIDGIPAGVGTFNQLSPQDIDNLSVLKDGAAAVYGNRAANGVILVTTKRGKSGKPRVNISTSYACLHFRLDQS
jgi:TonB-dependent SusC/RagA subfamily outer membrane receptor